MFSMATVLVGVLLASPLWAGASREHRGQPTSAAEADRILAETERRLPPDHPDLLRALGRHAGVMVQENRVQDAERDLDRLLAPKPSVYEGLLEASRVLLLLERPDQALARALDAERLHPDSAEPPTAAAEALKALGRREEAIEYLRRAVELDPLSYWPRIRLGEALRSVARYEEASKAYAEAKAIDPAQSAAYISVGYASMRAGEERRALAEFEEFARLNPSNPMALHHLAAALFSVQRSSEACALLKRAVELHESSGPVQAAGWSDWVHTKSAYGDCQLMEKRFEEAIQTSLDVTGSAPKYSERWLKFLKLRALAMAQLGRSAQAEQEVQAALRERGRPRERVYLKLLLYQLPQVQGDHAATVKAAGEVLDELENPALKNHCDERIRLPLEIGVALEAIGASREAEQAYRRGADAPSCDPSQIDAHLHFQLVSLHLRLMRLAGQRGDCAGAQQHRAKAVELAAARGHEPELEAVRQATEALRRTCPQSVR